jgi:predicted aspartyl protease
MATTTVALRISSDDDPLLLVPAMVNGLGPFDFVVDTGASHVVIDAALAGELDLPHQDTQAGHGAGGPITVVETTLERLCVADACAVDLSAVITDLTAVAQAAGVPLRGVLGYPFLSRYVVTIDYPGRRLHLAEPA